MHTALQHDCQLTVRLLEQLHINQETICHIITEDLGKKKICARFVPHVLTAEQKADQVASCEDLLTMHRCDPAFLTTIVTGDELWCFAYDPTTKRQSAERTGQGSPRPQKLRWQKSRVKTMLIAFFDSCGMIHTEFVPLGQTVNADFYKRVLDQLLKRIVRVRPDLHASKAWCLLHDKVPSPNALFIRQFLAKKNITSCTTRRIRWIWPRLITFYSRASRFT